MIKGTTPVHTYGIAIPSSMVDKVRITHSQNDEIVTVKEGSDVVIGDSTVATKLTQEETLMFDTKHLVEIQVRILTTDGDAISTLPFSVPVFKCLDGGML